MLGESAAWSVYVCFCMCHDAKLQAKQLGTCTPMLSCGPSNNAAHDAACCILLSSVARSCQCRLVDYNAALATVCFMLFLGFADDVLDIPWR